MADRPPLRRAIFASLIVALSLPVLAGCEAPADVYEAAARGNRQAVSRMLARGEDINARSTALRWAPLHVAAAEGHDELVAYLIARGADVNARDVNGNTPLHLAAGLGHEDTVGVLLVRGADPTLPNEHDELPVDLAEGHPETLRKLMGATYAEGVEP